MTSWSARQKARRDSALAALGLYAAPSVIAGMIQEQTKQQINGVPGLMQLPILGSLFKSRDYINHQTELMVIVTLRAFCAATIASTAGFWR